MNCRSVVENKNIQSGFRHIEVSVNCTYLLVKMNGECPPTQLRPKCCMRLQVRSYIDTRMHACHFPTAELLLLLLRCTSTRKINFTDDGNCHTKLDSAPLYFYYFVALLASLSCVTPYHTLPTPANVVKSFNCSLTSCLSGSVKYADNCCHTD